jgi:hypothetical protein
MHTQTRDRPLRHADPARATDLDSVPWLTTGIVAGLAGAAVIAVVFLILDLLAGRPLWTPFALGSAFFLGEFPALDAAIVPALVAGYTVMHAGVFVAAGLLASFELMTGSRLPGATPTRRSLLLAALLFVGLEAVFLLFASLMAPQALELFGVGRVAIANGLAAVAMAAVIRWGARHRGLAVGTFADE